MTTTGMVKRSEATMEAYGATCIPSPSKETEAGRRALAADPTSSLIDLVDTVRSRAARSRCKRNDRL
jgi:predicted alternative tryptophan synthase beta-subunit